MEKYKIGGRITLEDNVSYRILDIIILDEETYLLCCTETKPIISTVFHCIEDNSEVYVCIENDEKILKKLTNIMLKK